MAVKSAVFISIEIDADLALADAWPDGVPDEPTAKLLAEEIKRDHGSLGSLLSDWDLDAGGTVSITVVDEEGKRTYANADYLF